MLEQITPILTFLLIAGCLFALITYGCFFGAMYMKIPTRKLRKIMEIGDPTADKTVMDLGAGYGTIAFEAAQHGATVIAVEIDPFKVLAMKLLLKYNNKATQLATPQRLFLKSMNIHVLKANLLKVDYSTADLIYCYLSPPLMQKIGAKATLEMKNGSKIISVEHKIRGWTPTFLDDKEKIYEYTIGKSNP